MSAKPSPHLALPVRIREGWLGTYIEDANGVIIASAQKRPWNGVPLAHDESFIRANFEFIVAAINGAE